MNKEYDPFNDDLPRVQIPLGADQAGLSIDGEFTPFYELPPKAREAYHKYAKQGGNIRIWQCERCGYLTDADALSVTGPKRRYQCGACGARQSSKYSNNKGFTQVHGPLLDPDDERYVDVLAVESDVNCPAGHGATCEGEVDNKYSSPDVDERAVECGRCVPNHPSHLGRLQNAVEGEITQSEMMRRVAEAVKEFREA